ncbi:AMP-binding protein [Micromonospora chalcea]|uniref:AMP-binding protein n=1 Tax=Micromonospora chalcea TaxID=1874 RepID=UPI00380D8284
MASTAPPTLISLWYAAAARHGSQPALLAADGWSATYHDVSTAAATIETSLRSAGLSAGDTVLISLSRGPLWLPAMLAIWQAGGVPVMVRNRTPEAMRISAAHSGACLLLGDGTTRVGWPAGFEIRVIGQRRTGTTTADHAYAMPTSGTTGEPKLALVTHATATAVMTGLRRAVPIAEGERALHTAAFNFSSSIRQLLLPLLGGAAVSIFERSGRFDPRRLLQVLNDLKITMLDLTPSQLATVTRWLELDADSPVPTSLRRLLVASEAFAPGLMNRWKRAVPTPHPVFHLYGQTELGGAVSVLELTADPSVDRANRLPLAPPFPPFTAAFDDRPDGLAELLVAGLDSHDGYLTPAGLDRTRFFTVEGGDNNLYRTGDLFSRQTDGIMTYQGRVDNEVKILGVRVDALSLEQLVAAIPGIVHVAALPIPGPDANTGLRIAYTTDGQDVTPTIADVLAGQLDPALPAPVPVRLETMPLTASGKIDRAALLHTLRVMSAASPAGDDGDALAALWRRCTRPGSKPPDEDQNFFAAGGHSLSMLELLAALHHHHGARVLPEQFQQAPTLAGLRRLVEQQPPSPPSSSRASRSTGFGRSEHVGELPANNLQRQVWLAEQLASDQTPSPFWLNVDLDIAGTVEPDRLTTALRLVAARFDILRVAFTRRGSSLVLLPDSIPADEFTAHTGGHADEAVPSRLLTSVTGGGPLLQLGVAENGSSTTVGIRVHHSIADRRSIALLTQALASAYTAPDDFAAAPAAPSFLAWHRQQLETAAAKRDAAAAYWQSVLPAPSTTRSHPGQPRIERTTMHVRGHPDAAEGSTPHAMWLWAYRVALGAHQVPQPELVGIDVDLRLHDEPNLVGPCVHTLPAVIPDALLAAGQGPRAAMSAIVQVLTHRLVPISDVVPASRRPTGDPRQPFFRNSLVYQADPYPELRFADRPVRYRRTPPGIAGNTVTLYVRNVGASTALEVAWDTRIIDNQVARDVLATTVDALGLLGEIRS